MTKTLTPSAPGRTRHYEASDAGPASPEQPAPPVDDGVPQGETEYEVVGSVDRNIQQPDGEATNARAESAAGDTAWEFGDPGIDANESAGEPPLDAIYGSYPDLIERDPDRNIVEVIIGPDNRVRVANTGIYPWRAICGLRILAANGQRFIGTGWLIGPRTVVTAGHCVFLHDAGGWARSIEVIPGLNDASRPYGTHTGTVLRSVNGWTQGKNREFDYGAIILPPANRPGAQTGTFGFAVRDDAFLRNSVLNLSGYPGDKGGSQQWFHALKPKGLSSRVITYDIDTMGGQSGSPVWVLQNGQRYAVGVHTNGAGSGNSATRIVQAVYDNLLNWKNQGV